MKNPKINDIAVHANSEIMIGCCCDTRIHSKWRKHIIDRPGILLSVHNSGLISYMDHSLEIHPGDMILYDALPKHDFFCPKDWGYYFFHLPRSMFPLDDTSCNTAVPGVYLAHFEKLSLVRIKTELHEAYSLSLLRPNGWEKLATLLLQVIVTRFFQAMPSGDAGSTDSRLQSAIKLLENFAVAGNLEEIANSCGMSRSDFFKKFRESYGCSPMEYRNNLVISKAKVLLCSTCLQIQEIAYQLNFQDHYYFTKFFRKCTGLTPSDFRSRNRK